MGGKPAFLPPLSPPSLPPRGGGFLRQWYHKIHECRQNRNPPLFLSSSYFVIYVSSEDLLLLLLLLETNNPTLDDRGERKALRTPDRSNSNPMASANVRNLRRCRTEEVAAIFPPLRPFFGRKKPVRPKKRRKRGGFGNFLPPANIGGGRGRGKKDPQDFGSSLSTICREKSPKVEKFQYLRW